MNQGLTQIVYILDRSGSMAGLESDTINGFNSMMEKQKKTGGKAYVSTVLFNNRIEVLHDRVPIQEVEEMTDKQYFVSSCTALLDAVGGAIHHIGNVHKYARKEDVPAKTIFVITTDGKENASTKYSYKKVKEMIEYEQEKYGWEFIFIGANMDAVAEAQRLGIREERAVDYICDGFGSGVMFGGISKAVCGAMTSTSSQEMGNKLDHNDWAKDIRKDFKKRSRKKR